MKKVFNPDELEKLVNMYENTQMTFPEMADELGTTVYFISKEVKHLKDDGRLSTANRRSMYKHNRLKATAELARIGVSNVAISTILDCSWPTTENEVRECIKCGLLNEKPHKRIRTVDVVFVLSVKDKGLTKEEILQKTRLSDNELETLIKYIDMYQK